MTAPERSYWAIVKGQFRKHRTAVWGLRIVAFLFLLAVCAPLLAQSAPFAFEPAGGEWETPWFDELLDQNVFPNGVDLFFNLALCFLPVALVIGLLPGRRILLGLLAAVFLYCYASIVLPASVVETPVGRGAFFPERWLRYSRPKVDWHERRRATLEPLLCRQKVAFYEGKVEEAERRLQALGSGEGLDAEREAERLDLEKDRRQLARWQARLERARADASDHPFTAIMPPIGYHHDKNDEERLTEAPTWTGWGVGHFLGTDSNGRDVAARLLYGIRVSLTVGVIAVSIYCTIGVILGSIMGYFGGRTDMLLMRVVEIVICFPMLPFILILVAVFRTKNIFLIVVGIAVIGWTTAARLIRGQFLQEKSNDYVAAAQALGVPTRRIVFKHVLPNAIHPIFVTATFGVAAAILVEASLAFLGLGDPNVPSWGQILLEGRTTMKNWLIFGPGVAIFVTVTVLNLVGEGLRDALDPKLRQ